MAGSTRVVEPLLSSVRGHTSRFTYVCRGCRAKLDRKLAQPSQRVHASRRTYGTSISRLAPKSNKGEDDNASGYEPAENWDGLEWIGSKDWLYARDARPVEHQKFGASTDVEEGNIEQITPILRRAVIECAAVTKAGKPGVSLFQTPDASGLSSDSTIDVALRSSGNGHDTMLLFPNEETRQNFCGALGIAEDGFGEIVSEAELSNFKDTWRELRLEDSAQKFAIIKRIQQLTGVILPDPVINASKTAQSILEALVQKPKPTKVLDILQSDARLEDLSNVTIYGRRQSYVDKDKSFGRWKVIEQELAKRDLPIPGRRASQGQPEANL